VNSVAPRGPERVVSGAGTNAAALSVAPAAIPASNDQIPTVFLMAFHAQGRG